MNKKIGFLGLGRMAIAMLGGIISNGLVSADDIRGFDVSDERCKLFSELGGRVMPDARQTVIESDVVVLAVKPQNFTDLFNLISGTLTEDKLIISIAAGIPISSIKKLAGSEIPVIRVMPNSPILVNCGMSVMAYEPPVSKEQAEYAEAIFLSSGRTIIMDEKFINPAIAIHSSSPAYIYLFSKAVADYAESVGIDRDTAIEMFAQTLKGSAEMIMSSHSTLDELIAAVTSPNGTTAAALSKFNEGGFCQLIKESMEACTYRAEELARAD